MVRGDDHKVCTGQVNTSFQVGKYQTIGGAIFQIGTVCTEANFSPYGDVGDGDIGYLDNSISLDIEMYEMQAILAEETLQMERWLTQLGS